MAKTKAWSRVAVLCVLPAAACSTLVGADFDDLSPGGSGGSSAGSGGSSVAGTSNGGSAGSAGNEPRGGAGADQGGGAGEAGSAIGGSPVGGMAGETSGGAPTDGGAEQGGAGNAGEGGGGASGAPDIGVPPTAVVINELKGQGSGDDYIELYNPGSEVADISGCYVADDSNNHVTFPQGATIAPQGFVVVRLQQATSTGMVTTCFGVTPCYDGLQWGISAGGEVIFLHDSKGVLLDQLTYPDDKGPNNVGDGNAFGRIPNGGNTAGAIFKSPGATNNAVVVP